MTIRSFMWSIVVFLLSILMFCIYLFERNVANLVWAFGFYTMGTLEEIKRRIERLNDDRLLTKVVDAKIVLRTHEDG